MTTDEEHMFYRKTMQEKGTNTPYVFFCNSFSSKYLYRQLRSVPKKKWVSIMVLLPSGSEQHEVLLFGSI